jgi:mannose-6-phosphate isomerase-like protein (cupin superfamily)
MLMCVRFSNPRIPPLSSLPHKPGESLKKHVTPVNAFFYVLEGTGIVEIGDERQSVGKDSVVESPAMIAHTWINESNTVFRVMVVKMLTTGKGKDSRLL